MSVNSSVNNNCDLQNLDIAIDYIALTRDSLESNEPTPQDLSEAKRYLIDALSIINKEFARL